VRLELRSITGREVAEGASQVSPRDACADAERSACQQALGRPCQSGDVSVIAQDGRALPYECAVTRRAIDMSF
jgi:hypothetical protein